MSRLFLSPSGVSLKNYIGKKTEPSDEAIRAFLDKATDDEIRRASAELNSLIAMNLSANDKVLFLASDTHDGVRVANHLKAYIEDRFCADVDVKQVSGLQTDDRARFDREGITNLTEEVVRQIEDYRYQCQIIINATAGYKATIPYLTLIGMIFELPIQYLFEFSSELIELPPLPLQFDLKKLEQLSPVIDGILNDFQPVSFLCTKLGVNEYKLKEEFSSLLLEEDGLVMLRPAGRILYLRYLYTHGYRQIFINGRVRKKLESGEYDRDMFSMLFDRMKNPVYLESKKHNQVRQPGRIDLDCFKQGSSSERIFYYSKGKALYIGDIFMHDEYERFLANGRLLKNELEQENFTEF